jgi:DNA polymerase-3 subunit delta
MIVSLTGTNDFTRKRELRSLTDEFVAEYGDLALERLDGEGLEYNRLLDSIQSLPFLASRRMVVLDQPGGNKQLTERFEELVEAVSDTTDFIIVEPKPDKRSSYFKTLQKKTEVREFKQLDGSELARWLSAEAKNRDGELKIGDANYLIDRVGNDQLLLSNELDKLLLYEPAINRSTIDLLTDPAPQSTIFELLDAAFGGNQKRAMSIYDEQRKLKVEPQQIIAMLAWQLHILAIVKTAGQRSVDEIAREARLSPFVVRKTMGLASKMTLQQVRSLVARTLDLDVRLKSEMIDADDALKHLLMGIV